MFGFKLFLLSSYLHGDGYKIPSNSDLYNNKTKANLQTKFKHMWKTNKMQINKTAVGKGDTVSVKLGLCCCWEGGPRAAVLHLPGQATQLAHFRLGPLDCTSAWGWGCHTPGLMTASFAYLRPLLSLMSLRQFKQWSLAPMPW